MGHIYKITNKLNNKSYIGYTINPSKRWLAHQNKQGSKLVWQAIQKYGLPNFSFEVIAEDTVDNENNYIVDYNTIAPNGYNIAPGGGLPPNHKGKTYKEIYGDNWQMQIDKRTKTQLERGGYGPVNHSTETKQKISKAVSGKNNPMYGRTHNEDTLNKMRESSKGKSAGEKNGRAKKWVLTSPEGDEHFAHGNLRILCKELGLSFATVHSSYMYQRKMRSGWSIREE